MAESRINLFWTYAEIAKGGGRARRLVIEILVNIIMMLPIGALLPAALGKGKLLWTVLIGGAHSVAIELLQLILHRGLCELDDVFHNIIGILIGFYVYKGFDSFMCRKDKGEEKT